MDYKFEEYKFEEKLALFYEELAALFVERSVTETILYEFYNIFVGHVFVGHEVALNKIFFSAVHANTSFNKVVPFLVECRIDINAKDPWGFEGSAVDLVLTHENIGVANFLCSQGATLSEENISQLKQCVESKAEGDSAQIESGAAASASEEPNEVPLSGINDSSEVSGE